MNNNLIGKRYAKAILEVAVAENGIEKYEKELSLIESVIKSDKMFQNFLASKLIGQAEKKEFVEKVFKGHISDNILNMLSLIIDKNREEYIVEIAHSFQEQANEIRNIAVLDCFAATEISEEEQEELKKKFSELINKNIKISMHINENLLGGMRVEHKGNVIDGSVINKLDQYKRILVK